MDVTEKDVELTKHLMKAVQNDDWQLAAHYLRQMTPQARQLIVEHLKETKEKQ